MSYLASPEFLRVLLLGFLTSLHMTWRRLVNQLVPAPYLDEFFHLPQAQAYWLGKWSQWDPKITTPPGLYVFSYAVNSVRDAFALDFTPSINEWRATNVILLYLLLIALYVLTAVSRKSVDYESVLQREFSIIAFPLIWFFSALYYTDLFSVFTVVLCHIFWSAGASADGSSKFLYQVLHLVAGLVSLASRQTNIFWVAVYLGGLQVIQSVKQNAGADQVYDPPIAEAYVEDFPTSSISIAQSAVNMVPQLLLDLWPQLSLMVSFAAFVVWNGGVVLGDKDNHIATIHLPQMLYIWPFIVFFSWPVLLPQLSHLGTLQRRIPRLSPTTTFVIGMLVVIHLNTIIHPFTLADNRHYTFYIFRILRKHWLIKYAAVPIYYTCACLVLGALGGASEPQPAARSIRILHGADTVCVSGTLVWLIASSLSLVTAPLVEPRYFLLPWLMWRLSVPEYVPRSAAQQKFLQLENQNKDSSPAVTSAPASSESSTSVLQTVLKTAALYSPWLELAWYLAINLVTGYAFLYRGFEWTQEPGNVQRFMW